MARSPDQAAAPLDQDTRQLGNLNEGELRALLDEAVTYKTPKDREGKSSLFKNLLEEAEQDEYQFRRTGICGSSISSSSGKRGRGKRSLTNFPHSGSLQDLAGAGSGPDTRLLRPQVRQHRRPVPVSARSLHGGSLPANVDQQNFGVPENRHNSFEDVGCHTKPNDYIAIVKCKNPLPLSESSLSDYGILRVSGSNSDRIPTPPIHTNVSSPQPTYTTGYFDDDDGTEMEPIRAQKFPNYTSRLEISSITGDSHFNVVDTQHGCIPSPAISQPPPVSMLEAKPLQLGSGYSSVQSLTSSSTLDRLASITSSNPTPMPPVLTNTHLIVKNFHSAQVEIDKKNFDENSNNVNNVGSSAGTGHANKKKRKEKKICKNETQTLSHFIDGYRGRETLDDLIKFIEESDTDNVKHVKNQKSNSVSISGKVSNRDSKTKDDDTDKNSKKRSMERKSKDVKLSSKVRANSMEELSRRKFDDININPAKTSLTLRKSKKSVSDKSDVSIVKSSERRSWCNDDSDTYKQETKSNDADELSTGNLSHNPICIASKNKKMKQSQAEVDLSMLGYDSFCSVETSDFQTVTKKKKLRKRHSPSDENRGRPNHLYNNNLNVGKNVSGKRSAQERDAIYKRLGQGSRLSASSPPSDKSNDSNDDLDSVHSLPADASGERLQASYADMARAAPSASPPPPPPVALTRPHNFPDLIESCNYYANDISVQDKQLDNSIESTYQKDNSLESDKCKQLKTNCTDTGNSIDSNKSFTREQYPALESRQKLDNKTILKSKIENKYPNNCKHFNQINEKLSEKKMIKTPPKYTEINSNSFNDDVNLPDNYTAFVKHNHINSSPLSNESFQSNKSSKYNNNKIIENSISKHPDVVLPLAELTQSNNRPAVIIMNEEINRTTDNMYNVDGITFGFDINELLLNGDSSTTAIDEHCTNGMAEEDLLLYNSNIDFPAINEKPCRESKNNNEDLKHSKKATRLSGKDGMKCVNKNSIASETNHVNNRDIKESDVGEETDEGGQIVEARVGGDKSLRYLTPLTTFKDNYNLEKIVNYVGLAWEDVIKSPGGKLRYFTNTQ